VFVGRLPELESFIRAARLYMAALFLGAIPAITSLRSEMKNLTFFTPFCWKYFSIPVSSCYYISNFSKSSFFISI
jgi:hypothetical protein